MSDDDWSDSDDELTPEVETSVLLGVPDGAITKAAELADAAVSRIGGLPAFLPSSEPPFDSSICKSCSQPMELLVQMWCPFENSPMDRALYIWGCSRGGCQKTSGSVRAWRGLRYNESFAIELEKKLAKKKAPPPTSKPNPFSLAGSVPDMFGAPGLGAQIFGAPSLAPDPTLQHEESPATGDDDDDSASTSSAQSLITAMTATTLDTSEWKNAPSYPVQYLDTVSEYIPPQPKPKGPTADQVIEEHIDSRGGGGKDVSWAFEPYENSLRIDEVFERFNKRVGYEGEQCVRYELAGTPLPFGSDKVFEQLFPAPPSAPLPVTKAAFKHVPATKRTYTTDSVPRCPQCNAKRIFETQLMPNLINVLRPSAKVIMNDEERRKDVEKTVKGGNKNEKGAMEWGTCLVFSCENDCRGVEKGVQEKDVWREEYVMVQWDT